MFNLPIKTHMRRASKRVACSYNTSLEKLTTFLFCFIAEVQTVSHSKNTNILLINNALQESEIKLRKHHRHS